MSKLGYCAILLLCLVPELSIGRDIFVDNVAGDDRRDGSTVQVSGRAGGPVRSLRRALELAEGSDRIVMADKGEPYRESVTLQAGKHTGIATHPFTIVGNGATLDGSAPVPPDVWQHVEGNVFRFRAPRTSFQVLFLAGKPLERRFVDREAGFPKLQPLEWCLFDRHVYFHVENDKLPRQYDLTHTSLPVGITLYEARHIVISDLVIEGFQLDGLNAHDSVFDATFVGLTCRGNGRSGISVGGASRVKIIACLVGNNGAAQVRTEGFSRTEILNCDLIESAEAPAIVRDGGLVSVSSDGAPGS
ncbi:MAG: right-handed parallel beta-helix repeat-containing protein [Planctomycetaceae bacterium]|nr:right-handed parallel beta-helix repeat-containing protein [Planctomycetales bacterium]MCB9874590.1 right-handed parallel beta-helix repeat-containing protein [Planctomycetaceae bacterium]MCB9938644.1 right-handed parallel beta-helix repeat-containing protein [Planctomycetaceae bacterium]HRX77674.1 right-handed parallel beta-helix repeat-containing protein [Pirellulaceae bacterium]